MTKLQTQVLQLLESSKKHCTADDLYLLAKQKKVDVSLASIYRILNQLSEEKVIKRISTIGQKDLYDCFIENHEHLICQKCGKIKDVQISHFKEQLEKELNVQIDDYNLCITYLCDDCKSKSDF